MEHFPLYKTVSSHLLLVLVKVIVSAIDIECLLIKVLLSMIVVVN